VQRARKANAANDKASKARRAQDEEQVDMGKLRRYEADRMKYYYAVVGQNNMRPIFGS